MNYSGLDYSDVDDSDAANLPVEMLDQLRLDLETAENEAQFNSIPFIPKPRILGKRVTDRTRGVQDDDQHGREPFDIRTDVDDRAGDQIDEFRRGLSELDGDNSRNQRRYQGRDAAESSLSTNVHSIYEASDIYAASDSDSRPAVYRESAPLTADPVASGVPDDQNDAGQTTAAVTSAAHPNKLSAPVGRDSDVDDLATREQERESRANFVSPSLTAKETASDPGDQRAEPNPQAEKQSADTVSPQSTEQLSTEHRATAAPVETATPVQRRTEPERTRSIREVLKASLTRSPDTASAADSTPEDVADEFRADTSATAPTLPRAHASSDTIERAETPVDTGQQRSLDQAPQAEPQTAQPQYSQHDLPVGRYSKALRRRADQDARDHSVGEQTRSSTAEDAAIARPELHRAALDGDAHGQKTPRTADKRPATEHPGAASSDAQTVSAKTAETETVDNKAATAEPSDSAGRDTRRSIAAKLAALKVVNARTRSRHAEDSPSSRNAESDPANAVPATPVQTPAGRRTVSNAASSSTVPAAGHQQQTLEAHSAVQRQAESTSQDAETSRTGVGDAVSRTEKESDKRAEPEVLVHRHVPGNAVNKRLSTDDQAGTYTVFLPKLNTPDPVEQKPLVRDPVIVSLAVFSVLFMLTAATGFVISRDIDVDQWLTDRVTDVKSHANGVAENIQNLASKDAPEIAEQDHTSSIQPVSPKPEPLEQPSEQAVAVEQPVDTGLQPAPQPTNPNFEIDGENALTGSLISSNGEPVAGEQIVLVSPSLGARFTTTTRDDGEFTLENLMPGDDYNLSIAPAGPYKTLEVFDLSISESNAHLPLTLEAMPTANLSGRIVDADNNAVPNFQLWATGFDEPGQQVNFRSDHEGNYRLYGLPTGKVQFTSKADPKILITSVVLNGGADEVVDLVVDYGTHQIGGIATDADGNPLGGVEITLEWSVKRDTIRSMGTRTTSSDSDGSFRFSELGPGKHFLTARADGLPLIRRSIDVGIDNTEIALSLGTTSSDSQIN